MNKRVKNYSALAVLAAVSICGFGEDHPYLDGPTVPCSSLSVANNGNTMRLSDADVTQPQCAMLEFGGLELVSIVAERVTARYWKTGWRKKLRDAIFGPDIPNLVRI